ncbi:MAG: hypothetical protein GC129_02435 [Proteobacteria bacterium]|nr:hypothetical protein [Pseudomonadota bacterium]
MSTLQSRILGYASRPEAEMALFAAALAEGLFVPVSADILLVPMVLVTFDRAFRYAMIATAGSVLGGIVAYMLGLSVFGALGHGLVVRYGVVEEYEFLQNVFGDYNVILVVAAGLANVPYKIVTLLSGFFGAGMPSFIMAGIVSRGAHYFIVAWLLWRGGGRYQAWIDRYFQGLTMVMALGLLLFFVMVLLLVQTA